MTNGVEALPSEDGASVLAPDVLRVELTEPDETEIPDIPELSSDGQNVSDSSCAIDGADLSSDEGYACKPLSSHDELYLIYKKHN